MRKAREKRRIPGFSLAEMPGWKRREQNGGRGPASRKEAGIANRRILTTDAFDGIEVAYHATKGYRIRAVEV